MRTESSGQVTVVTGASSGIGRACAERFARRGDRLFLVARDSSALHRVASACHLLGAGTVTCRPGDVGDDQQVKAVVGEVLSQHARIDAWVHSAAVMAYGRFEDIPAAVFDEVVRTDLLGSANAARAVLPVLRRQGEGSLVLLGSVLGEMTVPFVSAYATSKWGLHGLVRLLRQENRDVPRVHVTLVSPVGVNTPIYEQAANYTGSVPRPPQPVYSADAVAAAVVRTVQHPPRRGVVHVGWNAWALRTTFAALPPVFDALVEPVMSRLGLTDRSARPALGNVFQPAPRHNARDGRWW